MRRLWSDFTYRLRAVFHHSKMEDDLDAELRFHLDREAEELERRGLPRDGARRQARLGFGGLELMKEETRDARGTAVLEQLLQDVRYGLRMLRKEPTFTFTIVLLLGLGIGANTATFTILQALLFRPLAVPHPEQLAIIGDPSAVGSDWNGSPQTDFVSFPVYKDVLSRTRAFSDIYAAGHLEGVTLDIAGRPSPSEDGVDHTDVRLVTGNYFDVLQVPASRGRTFTSREDTVEGGAPFAVISAGFWQRGFARDPSAIGSRITLNHVPLTIVGVMPPGFGDVVGSATDIWVPMMMQTLLSPQQKMLNDRNWSWLQMMGRLAPGVTLAQAQAEVATIEADAIRARLSSKNLAQFNSGLRDDPIQVHPGALGFSGYRSDYEPVLLVLMGAVGVIVLIVCANVANLMLVRAVARTREMTVRVALGAGRRRLLRQLFTETLLLAGGGGALGLFIARPAGNLLLRLTHDPISLDTGATAPVVIFAAGLTIFCALLFGLVPAFKGTRVDLATALRADGRSLIGSRTHAGRFAAGKALVVVQIMLSTVLLVGAGLLIRSMQRIVKADLGFDRDHIVMVHVPTQRAGYTPARAAALANTLPQRVRALPGVLGASTTFHGLFSGNIGGMSFRPAVGAPAALVQARYDAVGLGYFHAIGARLLAGREFDVRDSPSAANVIILNGSLAGALFGSANPLGSTLRDSNDVSYTVVGVTADMHESSVRTQLKEAYIPLSQKTQNGFWLAVRVNGDPHASVTMLRRAVLDTDPTLPVEMRTVNDLAGRTVAEDRLTMQVTAFFGIVALLLAALGLYGMTAYATSRRTGEFGLRIALGAQPERVARTVLRESAALGVTGVACGIPAAIAATRFIRGQIFGIGRVDPPSLAAAVAILIAMTMLAAYLPARRAARISPIEALRTE